MGGSLTPLDRCRKAALCSEGSVTLRFMSLAKTAPRRFGPRALPAYPSLVAVGVALAAASCNGPSARPASDQIVQVPAVPASAVAPAKVPAHRQPDGELRFAADDEPLQMSVGCKGDCPSPYEMAADRKDEAQILARAEHCARARGVDQAAATLRGKVGADGRATDLSFEHVDGVLSEPMRVCLVDLASKAIFTPPEKGRADRILYAQFRLPREPEPR